MEEILAYLRENGVSEEILQTAAQMAQSQMEQQNMEQALDQALLQAGAKNLTAVKSLIDRQGLSYADGKLEGIAPILQQLRRECGYLFGGGSRYQPQSGTTPPDLSQMTDREYFDYIKANKRR